jgi:hypothetical protein
MIAVVSAQIVAPGNGSIESQRRKLKDAFGGRFQ